MNNAEKKLAAKLLRRAACVFSHHGCSDFRLRVDGGLTDAEARELVISMNTEGQKQEDYQWDPEDTEYVADWEVMRYLSKKLEE
jgi:hypothetical protein